MKTIVQAAALFALVIMITTTSISLVTHHTLKNELISSVSNGSEQTLNVLTIHKAYPYADSDEIIADVLQNIILSKSSKGPLTVNIYSKDDLANGILEIEAIEEYKGLGGTIRQASYRIRAYVYQTEQGAYVKFTDPSTETVPSESWVFSAEDIKEIKDFLETPQGEFPSQTRNAYFLEEFNDCLNNS